MKPCYAQYVTILFLLLSVNFILIYTSRITSKLYTMNLPIFSFLVLLFSLSERQLFVNGLVCYECRSSGGIAAQAGTECISETKRTSECDKKYCTIYRREYVDPSGTIDEFHRSCEDTPAYLNAVIKTAHHVAYYRSCQQNLCNVGDGLVPFAKAFFLNDDSDAEIFVVPGIGSSSGHRAGSPLSLIHGLLLLLSSIVLINY